MDRLKYDRPAMYSENANGMIIAGHFNESDNYMTKRPLAGAIGSLRIRLKEKAISQYPKGKSAALVVTYLCSGQERLTSTERGAAIHGTLYGLISPQAW